MNKMVTIKKSASPDYDRDGYGWAMAQAALIRAGRIDQIDWENVAEEIESVGRSEKSAYKSQLIRILVHMLKWEAQPERRGKSWWLSIMNGRAEALEALEENPSLKSLQGEIHKSALDFARKRAALETGLDESVFFKIDITQSDVFNRAYRRPEGD
jgi:Domain of unknown function DUF29